MPVLVNIDAAAEILSIERNTLYRWIKFGSGPLGPDKTRMVPPIYPEGVVIDKATGERKKGSPLWVKSDVERFARDHGRIRAPATKREDAPA